MNWISPFAMLMDAGNTLIQTLFGSARQREASEAASQAAAQAQFASEFTTPNRDHWFERFIDGINRLPRPLFTLWIFALVWVMPVFFLESFYDLMLAYAVVPEAIWIIFGTVIAFYFGGRMQIKHMAFKKQELADIQKRLEAKKGEGLPWRNPSVEAWKWQTFKSDKS